MSGSTTISIPDQIQIVGEPGSFYTIVSLDSLGPDTAMLQNSRIVLEDACSEEKVEDPMDEEAATTKPVTEDSMNKVMVQAFTLTFLAEWGDRSQIATIALVR